MNNIGHHIVATQNEETCIKLLAAQKEIYTKAKKIFLWQIIFGVPIPIFISILTLRFSASTTELVWIFTLYAIVGSIGEIIFDDVMSSLKKKAANIQEQFDCKVLAIEWNKVLLPEKITNEIIYRYFAKNKKTNSLSVLYDWYSPKVKELPTNLASVVCQRTNCTYDFSLRKRFSSALFVIALITFAVLFLISASTGITVKSFIIEILAPSIPIFLLASKQILANKESIENLKSLRTILEDNLSTAQISTTVSSADIRRIQDKIYYNRILSPLLPNWVFQKLRNGLEAEMHFSVEETISELSKKSS
jgi:hypothetical protein